MSEFITLYSLIIFIPFLLLLILIISRKIFKKQIIKKIRRMSYDEKCILMNSLVQDLGYEYVCSKDIFSTTLTAWQRKFGYTDLYDRSAAGFNMIFDCEPVFFNYDNRTWRIELWKGQYGINTGGEIGIYHSDRILKESEYGTEVFQVVSDEELLDMSLVLRFQNNAVSLKKNHWWLTAFVMGVFSNPSDIIMDAGIRFPNQDMLSAFYLALIDIGYLPEELCVNHTSLTFSFRYSHTIHYKKLQRLYRYWVQRKNHLFCKLFLWITKPMQSSVDRLLYLYYQLPSIFRRTFRLKRLGRKMR